MSARRALRALVRDDRAAAAVEMALVAPLLIMIMFVSAELGRYFYHEHVLVKALRDGAIFASRAPIDRFNCTGPTIDTSVVDNTKALVRTGGLSGQTDLLPWWTAASASFSMTLLCKKVAGTTTLEGIYMGNGGNAPVITLSATLPYQTMMGAAGLPLQTFNLKANAEAAVLGI